MESQRSNNSKDKKGGWKSLLIWILIAVFLRWQVIEPRWIPSGSMLPTLQINERLLIEKVSPKLNILFSTHPQRDSIVVFKPPKPLVDAGYESNQALIKRVVGVAGDTIKIHDGKLIRNDIDMYEPWIMEGMNYEMDVFTVPDNSIWVLGDNRNNSLDSHLWGALPVKNVVGTAVLRYWPIKKIEFIRFPASQKNDY